MTPFPLLASLTFLKIRSWYRGTSAKHQHVPTNEKGDQEEEDLEQEDPDKIDFRQSESSQRLMPIVKKGGCALTTDPNGNIWEDFKMIKWIWKYLVKYLERRKKNLRWA